MSTAIDSWCKTFTSNDRPCESPCDPWHYTGSESYHKCEYGQNFMDYVRKVLPRKTLPIKVGSTGYIQLTRTIETPEYCWTEDEVGRMVIVVDDVLLFQRMTKGQILMYGLVNQGIFSDRAREDLIQYLQDKISHR